MKNTLYNPEETMDIFLLGYLTPSYFLNVHIMIVTVSFSKIRARLH